MIIDIHAHCFPDGLAARAIAKLQQASGLKVYHDGTASDLARVTRQAGIDRAMVMPIATRPDQTPSINRWALGLQNETLGSFGTLHPKFDGWQSEIRWLSANGFKGIKLHPEYQGFMVDDERCYPMYEAVFAAGLAILFHTGVDVAYHEPYRCPPERLARMLNAFPGGTVIGAHMGGYRYWGDVEKYLLGRELYLDTSFSLGDLGPERMVSLMRRHGLAKILFGTDAPWSDPARDLAGIQSLGLADTELSAVLGGNAARLLGLGDRPAGALC